MDGTLKTLKTLKTLTIVLIALFLGAAAALIAGRKTLAHLTDREKYETEEDVRSVLMTGTGRAFIVLNDTSPTEKGRFVSRLNIDLYPKEEKPLRLRATVWTSETADGEEQLSSTVIEDINPLYVQTEVLTIGKEHVTCVELETVDRAVFTVGTVAVDNHFHFNSFLFLFVSLSSFAVLFALRGLLISVKDGEWKLPFDRAFAVTALAVGTALVICLPAGKVGYDEETHLQAVLQMASFPSGELHVSDGIMHQVTVTEYNNPDAQPSGAAEQNQYDRTLSKASDYRFGTSSPDFTVLWNRVPAYLPMAVAMKAGKGLKLDWNFILRLTRLANLFVYVALMWLAIRLIPSGKALLTLIALLPQSLFLASTVSYDPFITGCLSVGIAFCLRLLSEEYENRRKYRLEVFLMLLFFVLGCLPKAVYVPLVLLAVLIPYRKEQDRKKKRIFTGAVLGLCLAAFLAFILPTLLNPSASGDVRGGAVSEMGQLEFIAKHPLTYAGILLSQMIRWFPQSFFGADCTVFLGHLSNNQTAVSLSPVPWLVLFVLLLAGGIASLIAKKRTPELSIPERAWTLLLVFGSSALVWTAMYVAFTEPGAGEIAGVQGRYFIPLMFPLYYALGAELPGKEGALLVRKEQMCYNLLMVGMALCLGIQFFKAVVLPYCM